jgi:hypothetical protein
VMRCNPQHYYLLHEMGHRLGMPHAIIYKLTQETSRPTVSCRLSRQGGQGSVDGDASTAGCDFMLWFAAAGAHKQPAVCGGHGGLM